MSDNHHQHVNWQHSSTSIISVPFAIRHAVCQYSSASAATKFQPPSSFNIERVKREDGLKLVSTWMPSQPSRPAVTFTSDLQNLIRSSVVLLNIPCKFHRVCSSCSWDIVLTRSVWTNERTNEETNASDEQPENIMSSPTLAGGESIKLYKSRAYNELLLNIS